MRISLLVWLVLSILLVVGGLLYYPKYLRNDTEATLTWDVSGYYWYLPATFIYHDLKELRFSDSIRTAYACSPDNQQITTLPNQKRVLKYSSGMALQYLPFFAIAHASAYLFDYPPDGFSRPYQAAIHFGGLLLFIIGLYYLRRTLLFYFSDRVVAWVLFFLVLGTNYLNYASIDTGMSHVWLFSWYALLLYLTHQYYCLPSRWKAMGIGFICGLLALSRPTEIIAIVIPLFWGVKLLHRTSWKQRFQWIRNHVWHYFTAIVVMLALGCIQLIYWKYATGHWLVYSYGDQSFSWFHPHVFLYALNFKSGWLIYTPLLIFALLGFLFLGKKQEVFLATFLFFGLSFWSVTAWDIWNYGGRAMIQSYAVLMFPLAALLTWVNTHWLKKLLFYPFAFIGVYLNIWWVHGVHRGRYIAPTDMTEAYYKKIVGRFSIEEQDRKLLDVSEDFTGIKKEVDTLFFTHFNEEKDSLNVDFIDQNYFLNIPETTAVMRIYSLPPQRLKKWVRLSADIICAKNNWDILRMTPFGIEFFKEGKTVKSNIILLDRLFYKEQRQIIYVDAQTEGIQYDSAQVFLNNPKEAVGSFYLDWLCVETFE
ncbi:MAG: hypothetical protein JNM95_14805 [Chitinophagaceae bacterium]|nr:hypothetical protein [Chitinophagaceae bacterium]